MTIIDKRRGFDPGSDAAQQAAQRGFDANVPNHVKTGVRLTGIVLSPAHGLRVPHKLGRIPVGWHMLRAVGPSTGSGSEVHESASDVNTITFIRPGGVSDFTYDFWVF